MAFEFAQTDKSVEKAVRRIAAEQIAEALAALDDTARPLAERIHAARKSVKKLRGLLRLIRPGFRDYATENAALRDAGRRISALREVEVTNRTLADIAQQAALSAEERAGVAAPLEALHAEEHDALDEACADFRAAMTALARRAQRWRLEDDGFDALADGLAATWGDTRKAMARALKRGRDEDFHEWRKRAKDHWYQARLLVPIWPEMMAPHVAAADRLGEALGDFNDLSVLIRHLAEGEANATTRARLVEEAMVRREKLLDEARGLGRRLFAGTPEALTDRWRVWWKAWRG